VDRDHFERTFWARVSRIPGQCWEWLGPKDWHGYGRHSNFVAHRIAYELAVGPIPLGLVIDHLCRNPSCVNPEHLEPVTNKVNVVTRGKARAEYSTKDIVKLGCPDCGESLSKVIDSRPADDEIRRRRECPNGHRSTTYEYILKRTA
jgi:hypothetical protein